mmetsp:Transcript_22766/g.56420  ORF Transcript_22766/g.56420 Transcript_22766/m.56420 type:complete len:469 (+) Transcript_22766:274-1680(+)|eukprot:CAMPEP_0116091412 /NCGR_PEP_ID=MMETSP0327-20121206/7494_1 /TAXON_ID=44447 /ORGANISM="Pseudo-nitzschia delicatissima, Strain B596" /LENGTH=468 /DNA_ID=CAMNT_0003582767 /DNA_START=267 /DNA_END=1673 /DNA_ORIENTATION=+
MVTTRSRLRGTGENEGVTRTKRSSRTNAANVDDEPIEPKSKRQRTAAATTTTTTTTAARATRKSRALKPVSTNANSKPTRGKSKKTETKPVAKPRSRKTTQPTQDAEPEAAKQQQQQEQHLQPQETLPSAGATRAGANDETVSNADIPKSTSTASLDNHSENSKTATENYQDGEPYDIDARDAHDPLSVTDYVEDMYRHFRWKEEDSSCNRMYMGRADEGKQPHINETMRCILVDWLIEVHYKFKLFPETLYLTVNILDRFLSETPEIVTKRDLQLVGVTSLLVSAKYEEMYVPELRDLTYICDGAYTEAKILRMEEKILKTLQYNVTVPTPHTFLIRFLKAAKADKLMAQLACFLLDGTLLSLEKLTCIWRPSQLAAAAILLARRQVGRHNWSPTLVAYSQYREEDVMPVARSLLENKHRLQKNSELMALNKKYSKTKYGKVSHIAFLPLDADFRARRASGDSNNNL